MATFSLTFENKLLSIGYETTGAAVVLNMYTVFMYLSGMLLLLFSCCIIKKLFLNLKYEHICVSVFPLFSYGMHLIQEFITVYNILTTKICLLLRA